MRHFTSTAAPPTDPKAQLAVSVSTVMAQLGRGEIPGNLQESSAAPPGLVLQLTQEFPWSQIRLRSIQLRPELAGVEPKAWETSALIPPPGDEIVAGDTGRRGVAVESRHLALAGLEFYDLAHEQLVYPGKEALAMEAVTQPQGRYCNRTCANWQLSTSKSHRLVSIRTD